MATFLPQVFSGLLFFIFTVLALLHFNWALGSKWGLKHAVPTKDKDEPLFIPGKFITALVGIGLLCFALYYLHQVGYFLPDYYDFWIFRNGGWILGVIFLIRAIGDFNYAGFFRKIKDTNFAEWDRTVYTPLCLLISMLAFFVEISKMAIL